MKVLIESTAIIEYLKGNAKYLKYYSAKLRKIKSSTSCQPLM